VIKTIEIGVVAGFLGLDEAVRLPVHRERNYDAKGACALFRQSKDLFRVGLVPFDAALLDESLVAKMLDVILHRERSPL